MKKFIFNLTSMVCVTFLLCTSVIAGTLLVINDKDLDGFLIGAIIVFPIILALILYLSEKISVEENKKKKIEELKSDSDKKDN